VHVLRELPENIQINAARAILDLASGSEDEAQGA